MICNVDYIQTQSYNSDKGRVLLYVFSFVYFFNNLRCPNSILNSYYNIVSGKNLLSLYA